MASWGFLTKLIAVVLILSVAMAPRTGAVITCTQVIGILFPCEAYLKSGVETTMRQCCDGIRILNILDKSKPDRQVVCSCLKSIARAAGLNYAYTKGLSDKCGLSVGYRVDPSTDCARSGKILEAGKGSTAS
ncbi:Non-specific lipid-transfer protein-like protein [Drosera capensis]